MGGHGVQELLERQGFVVAEVIDTGDAFAIDGGRDATQEVGQCKQVRPCRLSPDRQETMPQQPSARFNHQDPATIDHTRPQRNRNHACPLARVKEVLLGGEPGLRVYRVGIPVQAAGGGSAGKRFSLDVGEADQDEFSDAARQGRGHQMLHVRDVRLRQEAFRLWGEQEPREVDDAVSAATGRNQRIRIFQIRSVD
jgi:hypothetical protein